MTEALSRRRARRHESLAVEPTSSSALYGPDPLEQLRDAVLQRDPDAFVHCFAPDGYLRVPRREGDIVLRGHDELGRAGRDLRAMIRECTWTPSRRLVSAAEVTEEVVLVVHQHEHRAGRASAPPTQAADHGVRVPLRAMAAFRPDGLISALTVWLDWAALLDPKGLNSADGLASTLIALARERDDRGLRVLQTPLAPLIAEPPADREPAAADRPKPMSRGAIWWEVHRNTFAGSVMALAALVLLSWVGLNVLAPLRNAGPSSATAAADEGSLRGADAESGPRSGSKSTERIEDGRGSGPGESGTGEGANRNGGQSGAGGASATSDPRATGAGPDGSGAPVLSSQKPDVAPTVQPGREFTFLSDVLFPFNSFELSPRASSRLDNLTRQVRAARVRGVIQVNGYTDSTGGEASNMELSRQRALAVARALSPRLGQTDIRLDAQGFGETSPRRTNDTEQGRRANRRVTVVLPEER